MPVGTLAHLAKVGSTCAMLHSTDGFVRALPYRELLSATARRDCRLERGVDTRTGPRPAIYW